MTVQHLECTLAEYHATKGSWSHSQIEDLIQSPALFHGRHITGVFPRESSPALDVGTIAHAAITDPDGLDGVLAIIPPEVLNRDGHRKGSDWLAWSDAHDDKIQMKRSEAAPVLHMVANVQANPAASRLLDAFGPFEYTMIWTDAESGLDLRARPDKIAETDLGTVVVDLKTTRALSPREFANDIVRFGYHRQAAWYLDAADLAGFNPVAFCFVCVDKSPAHECVVYQLDARAIELGRQQNRDAIADLARRLESDSWQGPRWAAVFNVDLPDWAYRENQWEE